MIPGREIRLAVTGVGGGYWLQRNTWRLWRVMRVFYILMSGGGLMTIFCLKFRTIYLKG